MMFLLLFFVFFVQFFTQWIFYPFTSFLTYVLEIKLMPGVALLLFLLLFSSKKIE